MGLRGSPGLVVLFVITVHASFISWVLYSSEINIQPSEKDSIRVSITGQQQQIMKKAFLESKSPTERKIFSESGTLAFDGFQAPIAFSGDDTITELIERDIQIEEMSDLPKPHYPLFSRRLREQGDVLIKGCIHKDGRTSTVTIDKSSGYQRLDQSALNAVIYWKEILKSRLQRSGFRCYRIPIRFRLARE